MNILLAVDGSKFTKKMLAYVAAHDEWLGPRHHYTVIHVVPRIPAHAASFLDRRTVSDYYAEEAAKVLEPIRAFFERHAVAADFVAATGHAAETIAKRAEAGPFDLLMMGSHGHGQVGNLVMGSVVTQVLARCRLPVLVVR